MKILKMLGNDPYLNLATEDYILCNRSDDDYLLLWQNDNTIVVGLHQNTQEEINSAFVEEHNIKVVRRKSGGGAVYHDLGNLNFSFITQAEDASKLTMERFTSPIVQALIDLGLKAEASGRNDILVGECKVSGNAQTLHKKRILHHGTLLFNSDLSVLAGALKVKPEKFQSKSVKSVRGRVGNISDFLPQPMPIAAFGECIIKSAASHAQVDNLVLAAPELEAILALRNNKYASWDWNFGRSPQFNFRNTKKFSGGFLEVLLDVQKGVLVNCKFFGDFMALRPANEVAEALLGKKFVRAEIASVLAALPLAEYFGSISQSEVLACLFSG